MTQHQACHASGLHVICVHLEARYDVRTRRNNTFRQQFLYNTKYTLNSELAIESLKLLNAALSRSVLR